MGYDVLIIGGRVAGSSLALLLARRGHRVLLADRESFPSGTLSTHFMGPDAIGSLASLGVLEDVEAAGFRRMIRARTWIDDCCVDGPIGPDGSFALAPSRVFLDSLVIDHAVRAGVEFRERVSAEALIEEEGRVAGAVLRSAGGVRSAVGARVVVGADGRHSRVAEWTAARKYREVPPQRPFYYGYYHGLEPLAETTLEVWFAGGRIGFVFPMRAGEDCIGLEIQPEDFETFRSQARVAFEAGVRDLHGMERRMREAVLEGQISGTRGIGNFFRKPYGPGWALTGDAGYLKDPSTGMGIGNALAQSVMLAEALDAYLCGADWEGSLSAFQRRRDDALLPGYEVTLGVTQRRDMPRDKWEPVKAVLCSAPHLLHLLDAMPSLLEKGNVPTGPIRISSPPVEP